jgi:hypothetical protein
MADGSGYPSDLLSVPGVAFDVKILDPAERIRAYIRGYVSPVSADGEDVRISRKYGQICTGKTNIDLGDGR